MPAIQRAPKIQQTEWEARKHRIIELYIDNKLDLSGPNGVIQTMNNEGFTATKSQYEHQFRIWEVRKNMKRREWDRVFQEQPQGGGLPLIIPENMRISATKLERARRRYAPRIPREAVSLNSSDATQGNIDPLMPTADRQIFVENPTSEAAITTVEPDRRTNTAASEIFHEAFFNGDQSMVSHDIPGTLTSWIGLPGPIDSPNIRPQALGGHYMDPHTTLDFSMPFEPSIFDLTHMDVIGAQYQAPSPQLADVLFDTPSELVPYLLSSAAPSPYPRGARQLRRNEWKPPSAVITSKLIEDIYNIARTALPHGSGWGGFYLANRFLTAINEIAPTNLSSTADVENYPTTHTLALSNLLSTETFFGEEFIQRPDDIPIGVATEVRLYSRLLRSLINGFTGLENISAAGILRFLIGHQATQLSIIQFLSSNKGAVARSLAENIFRAALESDNADIVKFLLDHTQMVDANDIVCYFYSERYTPLEIAAMNHSLGVLKILIRRNVNMTKSFSERSSSALRLLIFNIEPKSILDDGLLELVDDLLDAGATIPIESILMVLDSFVDPRLATHLIQNSAFHSPQVLFSNDYTLKAIVKNLEQTIAIKMMKLIIEKSQGLNVDWYLDPHSLRIHHALEEAINRGYEGVAEILIPYISYPAKTLLIARRARSQAITDLILLSYPACDKNVEDVDSLPAALEFGEQDGLPILEETDVTKRLRFHDFGHAFTTALEAGNLEFATKILDSDPDFTFVHLPRYDRHERYDRITDRLFNLGPAFAAALAHDFDDIAWKILAATFSIDPYYHKDNPSTLYSAIKEKKLDFVRAIIDFGFDSPENDPKKIENAVIELGDRSIIIDLCRSGFSPTLSKQLFLEFAVKTEQVDLFWSILEPCSDKDLLETAGQIAINSNNLTLFNELLDRGARLEDGNLLQYVVESNPSLVGPILEHYCKACPQGHPGHGWGHIIMAIQRSPESVKLLDMFLGFGLVTKDDLRGRHVGSSWGNLLMGAIEYGRYHDGGNQHTKDFIKRLIDAGGDVNATGFCNPEDVLITPLLQAIETKNMEIVKLLVQRGAEVNRPARLGVRRTPLQKAAELNDLEIVRFLLEKGADVNAPPAKFSGATALQFAAIHGNCHMAMMLIEYGARLDVAPPMGPNGRWPLEGAAENGRIDMIRLLWSANNGPFDDKQCRKAMRLAERQGHLGCRDMIKELMARPYINY